MSGPVRAAPTVSVKEPSGFSTIVLPPVVVNVCGTVENEPAQVPPWAALLIPMNSDYVAGTANAELSADMRQTQC